jgi:hypothetical protein
LRTKLLQNYYGLYNLIDGWEIFIKCLWPIEPLLD